MKKTFLLVSLAIILVMSLFLVSCEDEPEIKTYKVTFLKDKGDTTPYDEKTVLEGSGITEAPKEPTDDGRIFEYWKLNDGDSEYKLDTPVKSNLTLVAEWKTKEYTVSFVDGEGKAAEPQTVEYGKTATAPTAPTKEGHTFSCWRKVGSSSPFDFETEVITEDTVLEAVWDINTYTVTFYNEDGTSIYSTTSANHGQHFSSVVQPTPEKTGHVLTGWSTEKGSTTAYDSSKAIEGNLKLYPIWEKGQYKVSFICDDGAENGPQVQVVEFEGKATEPAIKPTRTGYNFQYWATSAESKTEYNFDTLVVDDLTLYPVWEKKNYSVTFMGGDGISNVPPIQSVKYEETATKPETKPTRTGYTFKYWATSAESETGYDFDTLVVDDLTLYPVFEISKFTVTFVGADGISSDLVAQIVEYNSTATDPNPTVKEGYQLFGWKMEGSEEYFNFETRITSSITLYADCRDITKVNISFYDGEKLLSSGVFNCNESIDFPTFNDVLAGCTIEKWIKADDKTEHTGSFNLPYKEDGYRFNAYIITELLTFNNGSVSASNTLKTSLDEISLSIPNTIEGQAVTSIANSAFDHCSKLISITIPETVTSMGSSVFAYCTGLKSAVIKAKVNTLHKETFNSCDALEKISLSSTITEIEGITLGNLPNLKAIYVSKQNKELKSVDGVLYNNDSSTLIHYPAKKVDEVYEIPNTVTIIGGQAFRFCRNLKSVTIPDNVTEIRVQAFSGCSNLTSIGIPNKVTKIGSYAFDGCTSLNSSITIPGTVTYIGQGAFLNCEKLESIVVDPSSITSLPGDLFKGCTNLTTIKVDQVNTAEYPSPIASNAPWGAPNVTKDQVQWKIVE